MSCSKIKVAFWNVQNLFGTENNRNTSDQDFTPDRGWDNETREAKLNNISKIIQSLDYEYTRINEKGPDLIGLCEVENEMQLRELIKRMDSTKYEIAEYKNSPDLRGIDTCLIFNKNIFDFISSESFGIDIRYPTRDILKVHLKIKENKADLFVLVTHWPSRRSKPEICQSNDTAQLRNIVAEKCGKIVDKMLKISKEELEKLSNNLLNATIIDMLNKEWNKNVLLMGDFNDDPYSDSLTKYLKATPDIKLCREWKEIFELRIKDERNIPDISLKKYYLEECTYLFNCMWKLVPQGTYFYEKTNQWNLFDQFIISRGLFYCKDKLELDKESIRIYKSGLTIGENLESNKFDNEDAEFYIDRKKIHPIMKDKTMPFVFRQYYLDDTYQRKEKNMPLAREPQTGYSDHFPIQCVININQY